MGHSEKESTMKKSEVRTGETYKVKVSGNIADVRITGENPHGGWDGVNVATNRKVRIKSAQRLRGPARRPAKRKKIVSLAEYEAGAKGTSRKKDVARTVKAVEKGDLTKGVTIPTGKKKAGKKAAAKADGKKRPEGTSHGGRTSGLDAAAKVLAEAGEPLNTKEMVTRMLAKGLWRTSGKTPAATIYAAIIREISAKGNEARFRKVERGKFELAK